ncbi:cytochrome c biogenesis heme-transporting ATPase CcmA [Acerihabitans sp. KWT182]|uniref:Cytochrome c biogenesis heme-transporting ATPase CcmA n=1 Tax=Acerihabitans sp. KWT182 TaxID=3157919 RepID=A0AAU7Q6L4_9GAMM
MLEAKNLSCIRDDRVLFSRLCFQVSPGEIVQIEGGNGTGKTSLLRILAGLLRPDAGEVCWRRRDIRRVREAYHRSLLYIGHQAGIKLSLTPLENLSFYQAACGGPRDEKAIWHALEQAGLLGYEELPAAGLSAGQQRRVALARLWLSPARLWLLDEPFTAIDRQGVDRLLSLFDAHSTERGIVMLTTHQALPDTGALIRKIALTPAREMPCSG